jgi:hypothetical protein
LPPDVSPAEAFCAGARDGDDGASLFIDVVPQAVASAVDANSRPR